MESRTRQTAKIAGQQNCPKKERLAWEELKEIENLLAEEEKAGKLHKILLSENNAILRRESDVHYEIIVADGYNHSTGKWDQGHYFTAYHPNSAEKIAVLKDALGFWEKMGYK